MTVLPQPVRLRALALAAVTATACAVPATARAKPPTAHVRVDARAPARVLAPDFFGTNAQLVFGPFGALHDDAFVAATKRLQTSILRWPGGKVAEYWNWRTGWFHLDQALCCGWLAFGTNTQTLSDIGYTLGKIDARGVFVLNMVTPVQRTLDELLQDQLEMLDNARTLGIPVRYVELGNELYFLGNGKVGGNNDYGNRYPTAQAYAAEAERWASAIKERFPGVRVAAVGALPHARINEERRLGWMANLSQVPMPHVDAVTMHDYFGTEVDAANPVATALATPFVNWAEYQNDHDRGYQTAAAAGKRVWVTEYNVGTDDDVTKSEWLHGLMTATKTLHYLDDPLFERVTMHALTSVQFGAMSGDPPYGEYAEGEAMELYGAALRGATTVQPLTFQRAPSITVQVTAHPHVAAGAFSYPSLIGYAFTGNAARGKQAVIVNESGVPFVVDLKRIFRSGFSYTQKSAAPTAVIDGTTPMPVATGDVAGAGSITLAPYSITEIARTG
jgi:hypothetical protein